LLEPIIDTHERINVMDADEIRIITAFGAKEVLEVYKENLLK
jgi:hypothetical protein